DCCRSGTAVWASALEKVSSQYSTQLTMRREKMNRGKKPIKVGACHKCTATGASRHALNKKGSRLAAPLLGQVQELEVHSQAELEIAHLSNIALQTRDAASVTTAINTAVWSTELRMVEQIEHLQTELRVHLFGYCKPLSH